MRDLKKARDLLAKAELELQALREIGGNNKIADEIFGFLAQQAVEKSLKAWLAVGGAEYPLTQDLSMLLNELKLRGEDVERFENLIDLNPYAVQYRYELVAPDEPAILRDDLIRQVKEILEVVSSVVK